MNIEFGCGETPTKEGFKTCDIRDVPGVDFVCPAWDIDKYVEENTVDEIYSRHFFEHLTFRQGEVVLEKWHKILKPGGKCEMLVPNMRKHVNEWLSGDPQQFAKSLKGFWGLQRGEFEELWDVHKSGYTTDTLRELVLSKGFVNPVSLSHPVKSKHAHLAFFKK